MSTGPTTNYPPTVNKPVQTVKVASTTSAASAPTAVKSVNTTQARLVFTQVAALNRVRGR